MSVFFNVSARGFFGSFKFLKYLVISLCFVLFIYLLQGCSCGKIGDDPNAKLPPSNNDNQKPTVTEPVVTEPIVTISSDVPVGAIPSFVNSADGFITPVAKLPLKIDGATFSKTKIASAEKPCEASITLSVSNLITKTTPETDKAGSVSCSYVDDSTIELSIIPPDIQTTGNDLGVRPPNAGGGAASVAISSDYALQLTLYIDANNDYVEGITKNIRFTKGLQLKAKAVSQYSTDISQLTVARKNYGILFNQDIVVIDAKSPSTFFTFNAKNYVGGYENSWVGIKSPWGIAYYIFERSRNNTASYGYFHMHELALDRLLADFKSETGNISSISWRTARDNGGRVFSGVKDGIYINHNAPFYIGGNGNLVGFHGGYYHRSFASGGFTPKRPIVKTINPVEVLNTVPDIAPIDLLTSSDAGHDIFQVVPRNPIYLKVGRHTAPYIQQLVYTADPVNNTATVSLRDVPLTGDAPSPDAFQKGNRALRIAGGNVYFYMLGGSTPFVGTVAINPNVREDNITDVKIESIENPLGTVDLNLPYVVYNDELDALILYISGAGTSEGSSTKIFIGRFDDANDSTPTWTRYF